MNRIFFWFGVMDGICTSGVAFAIANTRNEAKSLILAELEKKLNGEVTQSSMGGWIKQVDLEQMLDRISYDLKTGKRTLISPNEDSITKAQHKILLDTLARNLDGRTPYEFDMNSTVGFRGGD